MKKYQCKLNVILQTLLYLAVVNSLIAVGFVVSNQISLYLPEYGQDFWWAWGMAFLEAPENIAFIFIGFIALIILKKSVKRSSDIEL